jgi:pSer/pThr/pTyr-binding forkhead associated (FHA) protein
MPVKMRVVQGRPVGKTLVFTAGEYYFGRGAECHVRPNSEWVSRQHCLLRVDADAASLRDLGSRNGTLVNGALLHEERRLRPGDQVQIGPLVFEIQFEKDNPASRAANSASLETASSEALDNPPETMALLASTEHLLALPSLVEEKRDTKYKVV